MLPIEITTNLKRIEQELDIIRFHLLPMIPESPSRDDPTWEARNCAAGAASATKRAWQAMERAIDEL